MLLPRTRYPLTNLKRILNHRFSSDHTPKDDRIPNITRPTAVPKVNPIDRTIGILKDDLINLKNFFVSKINILTDQPKNIIKSPTNLDELNIRDFVVRQEGSTDFQTHCDVLIIGGGGVGASVAYWLKKRAVDGLSIVVLEKDPTYKEASTTLSVGGLRQQFSLEENIQMSMFGAEFMRNVKEYLDDDVALNFTPHGYLMLASQEGAEVLQKNSQTQHSFGARNELLSAKQLKAKFPWINTEGIEMGCHGLENEGWFDPWALLMGFKRAAKRMGVHFVQGEAVGFEYSSRQDIFMDGIEPGSYCGLDKVQVKLPNGDIKTIKFAISVLAAGAQSGNIARLADIGTGKGMLSIPLPVEPRKRYVYVFETQGVNYPGLNTPLTIDPTNVYFRRDGLGGNFLCGRSPQYDQEPLCDNLDVDYKYFETDIWPALAHRVPAFESLKLKNAWAGYYEYNTYDKNGIIGVHPYYHNLYIATGFSGHGIQQTPAVGRAISELIIDSNFTTIDLSRLCFDRIIVDQPMYEVNVV